MPLCRKTSAVALGSNLGDPLELLSTAAQALQELAAPGSFRCSPLFRTAPVGGPADQPDFINAVVLLDWQHTPEQLLEQLQELEAAAGRQRLIVNGPRSLDLDLLWWGGLQLQSSELELPHPRWRERAFVLAPLVALNAGFQSQLEQVLIGEQQPPLLMAPRAGWAG